MRVWFKLLSEGPPSIGLFSDEGGRMIGGHAMNADNLIKTSCGLSSLWDGKSITRIRSGDEKLLLYGRRLTLHLMVQGIVLRKILDNEILAGQGFISRCLIVAPLSNAGNRTYTDINIFSDPVVTVFYQKINDILMMSLPLIEGSQNELRPRELNLEAAAITIWIDFHNTIDGTLPKTDLTGQSALLQIKLRSMHYDWQAFWHYLKTRTLRRLT